MTAQKRVVAVASGAARALWVALEADPVVRGQLVGLVTDRACTALETARAHDVPATTFSERDNSAFSDRLAEYCEERGADYVLLFFNRLLVGEILERYKNRIVNVHLSLLPAFKGLHARRDNLASGARFFGTTFHFIDERADEGSIILQAAAPLDPRADPADVAHTQFIHICKGLVQLAHWLEDDRIEVADGRVAVAGARYDQPDFSPALEVQEARALDVPRPGS